MGLMKIRERAATKMRRRWPFRLLQGPPSRAKLIAFTTLASALGGYSLLALMTGDPGVGSVGLLLAALIALVAHENWLGLQEAREKQLPERILCPSCDASILLTERERRECRFACRSCGKDFEVTDESEATP